MIDPFQEPKVVLESITREFTTVGSLNTPTAFNALVACEGAVGALYKEAMGKDFPYQSYPRHKPGQWVTALGISSYYSSGSQRFLAKIDGYALDKARYEGTSAFRQYTVESAADRSRVLVEGTAQFIGETERLATVPEALAQLRLVSTSSK